MLKEFFNFVEENKLFSFGTVVVGALATYAFSEHTRNSKVKWKKLEESADEKSSRLNTETRKLRGENGV